MQRPRICVYSALYKYLVYAGVDVYWSKIEA